MNKENHQRKYPLSVAIVLTVCVLLLALAGCAPDFEGNSVKNADCYELEIEAMNGTDTHALELQAGDTLKIRFETVKGSLTMKITAPDGTALYQGDGTVTDFTVEAPLDGGYSIAIVGRKAKGSIRIDAERVSTHAAEGLTGLRHPADCQSDDSAVYEAGSGALACYKMNTFPCKIRLSGRLGFLVECKREQELDNVFRMSYYYNIKKIS